MTGLIEQTIMVPAHQERRKYLFLKGALKAAERSPIGKLYLLEQRGPLTWLAVFNPLKETVEKAA